MTGVPGIIILCIIRLSSDMIIMPSFPSHCMRRFPTSCAITMEAIAGSLAESVTHQNG